MNNHNIDAWLEDFLHLWTARCVCVLSSKVVSPPTNSFSESDINNAFSFVFVWIHFYSTTSWCSLGHKCHGEQLVWCACLKWHFLWMVSGFFLFWHAAWSCVMQSPLTFFFKHPLVLFQSNNNLTSASQVLALVLQCCSIHKIPQLHVQIHVTQEAIMFVEEFPPGSISQSKLIHPPGHIMFFLCVSQQ